VRGELPSLAYLFAQSETTGTNVEEMLSRGWNDLMARDSGPLHMRLVLQPVVAVILAIRAGWADAREGRAIFFWTLLRDPTHTRAMLQNLWKIVGKVFIVAIVLDVVYQVIVLHWIYPLETLIVATMLALVPCMLVRAVGNRIVTLARLKPLDDKKVAADGSRDTSHKGPATHRHTASTLPQDGRENQGN
jgi:hypothetical protein